MKKILLLLTGGTISMQFEASGTAFIQSEKAAEQILSALPTLRQLAEIDVMQLFSEDSSNIHSKHWSALIETITTNYDKYEGFVILHGTDTMAYTASALSFGLRNLTKPIILTGSQVPLVNIRSDARRNLINAVELATSSILEVGICFNDRLYRGNRTTKMSIGDFDAFSSPNFEPLAKIGTSIQITKSYDFPDKDFCSFASFSNKIIHLKAFPSMPINAMIPFVLDSDSRAVIIEGFGSGNLPIKGEFSFLPLVESCIESNRLVLIASQAPYDKVDLTKYENGKIMLDAGAIDTADMTIEAIITKLMHVLAYHDNNATITNLFKRSISGEISL